MSASSAAKSTQPSSDGLSSNSNSSSSVREHKQQQQQQQQQHPPTRRGIIVNIMVENADNFVEFIDKAAGAKEYFRFDGENGKILHLALGMGGVAAYVEELGSDFDTGAIEKPHVKLNLNCDDPLARAEKLLKAGATELIECVPQAWGAMYGQYLDPFGQIWAISNSSSSTICDVPEHLARKIIPFVSVGDAAAYMDFLSKAFDAEEAYPASKDPNGKIMHAEMKLNGGQIMIGDHCGADVGQQEALVTITLGVAAGEAMPLAYAFEANGGEIVDKPLKQFWGQVWGRCRDPFGHVWGICEPQVGPPPSENDLAVDLEIGAKYNWSYKWTEEDVSTMHCFGGVWTCLAKQPSISKKMQAEMPLAIAGAIKAGVPIIGPLVAVYFTWDCSEGGKTSFTCGPIVAAGTPAPEGSGFETREVGGSRCVTVVHEGPYDKMIAAYSATFEWIKVKGYAIGMPIMEVFENDPEDVEPEKLRTKICIPIEPTKTATT